MDYTIKQILAPMNYTEHLYDLHMTRHSHDNTKNSTPSTIKDSAFSNPTTNELHKNRQIGIMIIPARVITICRTQDHNMPTL
eukprot:5035001-Amphidinium_carterae.1